MHTHVRTHTHTEQNKQTWDNGQYVKRGYTKIHICPLMYNIHMAGQRDYTHEDN